MKKVFLRSLALIFSLFCIFTMISCSSSPSSGPSVKDVNKQMRTNQNGLHVIKVNNTIAQKLAPFGKKGVFSRLFPRARHSMKLIEIGDAVEVRVWEAPPAVLLGSGLSGVDSGASTAGSIVLPEQMVGSDGMISVPFAGDILVAGKTTQEAGRAIVEELKGKAHKPQALVKLTENKTVDVTVIGEVNNSTRMPLTAKKEKILDALAAAGGTKQPLNKVSLQLTRGRFVHDMPLEMIVNDPLQNIALQADDVITALYQNKSFTALGAIGKNSEVEFEAKGITLAQALARVGGLTETRADAKGVFIFRMESPHVLKYIGQDRLLTNKNQRKIPVIYQLDLGQTESFFAAQNMPVHDKDLLYIAEAPSVEIKRFIDIILSGLYPTLTIANTLGR